VSVAVRHGEQGALLSFAIHRKECGAIKKQHLLRRKKTSLFFLTYLNVQFILKDGKAQNYL
jgi:hypothetical protein